MCVGQVQTQELHVPLEDLYSGTEKEITVKEEEWFAATGRKVFYAAEETIVLSPGTHDGYR